MNGRSKLNRLGMVGIVLSLYTLNGFADLEDAEKAAEKARQNAIQMFGKFTQDNNVMGKAKKPDGSSSQGGDKTRFNKDDGVAYNSELTYHKNAFNVTEEVNAGGGGGAAAGGAAKPEKKVRRLQNFVSKHGGISASGGSSVLERKVYEFHQKYAEEEEKESDRKKKDEQEGVTEESVFRITKKPVEKKGGPPAKGDKEDEEDTTTKAELKDEVRQAVDDVGTKSFTSVERAAKDDDQKDNEKAVPWGLLLRDSAARALRSLRDEVTGALGQNRVRAVKGGAIGQIEMNEETPDCESAVRAKGGKELEKASASQKDRIQKDMDRQIDQCKQITKLNWQEVQPVFEKDPQGGKDDKLYSDGIQKENGIQRDLRNQRLVIDEGGKDIKDLESNWKYDEKLGKNKIAVEYDQDGNVSRFEEWTGKQQLDDYNKQLKEADEALPEVNSRLGKNAVPEFNAQQFTINAGERPLDEIADIPKQLREETFGPEPEGKKAEKPAETYDELIARQKGQD